MPNIQVQFGKDLSTAVTSYNLLFTVTPAGAAPDHIPVPVTLSVPRTDAADAAGYVAHYLDIPGAPALNPGDSVVVSVESVAGSSVSAPVVSHPVIVPIALTGPTNVVVSFVP